MEIILDPELLHHTMKHLLVCFLLWILVLFAILLDLWDGLYTARKTGQRIKSSILRVTIAKICEYWRFMLIGFLFDSVGVLFPFYDFPYVSIVFFIGLVGVEVKSMLEHAKRRKSHVAEAQDIVAKIIECTTNGKAQELITIITDMHANNKRKETDNGEL